MTTSGAKPPPPAARRRGPILTLRDLSLLEALFTARYLSTPQIQALFWQESKGGSEWGRVKACQQRLKKLHAAGLLRRISPPVKKGVNLPYIYALAQAGAKLVSSELGVELREIDWRPKAHEEHYPFMEHLLATTDFRIAISTAGPQVGVTLEEWLDEKVLRSAGNVDYVTIIGPDGGTLHSACIPDACFLLGRDGKRGLFMVETDLKTVTIAPSLWERRGWKNKCRSYVAWFQTEAYRNRYAGRMARVLTITSSQTRLEHLQRATEAVFAELKQSGEETRAQSLFWFANFADALVPEQVLTAPIWQVAGSDLPRRLIE